MAIRRIDPNFRKKVVSAMDEAIDVENSDMKSYAQTLDEKHIKFHKDQKPTYFLVKPIDPMSELEITEVHQKITPPGIDKDGKPTRISIHFDRQSEMSLKYFKACVTEVEEDGKIIPVKFEEFPMAVLQEIGSYAMLYAKLGDQQKKISKQS